MIRLSKEARKNVENIAEAAQAAGGSAAQVTHSAPLGAAACVPAKSDVRTLHVPRARRTTGRRRTLILGAVAALLLVAITVAGALLTPAAMQTDFAQKALAPSLAHPFGTDWMGRDMLARTLAGLSLSVRVGLVAAAVSSVIALVLGCASALGGPKVDHAITWLIDLMMGLPHIVLLLLISYALGKGFWGVTIGVALTHWPTLTRVIRAEVLQCKQSGFVAVARRLGRTPAQIARQHMVPYVLPQFLAGLVLMFPHAILHEAAITFLGFGLPPEQPAIGIILSESMTYLTAGLWWLAVVPGLCLVAVVMLFDAVAQAARRLADPKSAQE